MREVEERKAKAKEKRRKEKFHRMVFMLFNNRVCVPYIFCSGMMVLSDDVDTMTVFPFVEVYIPMTWVVVALHITQGLNLPLI